MRFVIDEDFDNDILRGVQRCIPGLNIVRVQDIGLSGANDSKVLEWAAKNQRVLLTHDVSTMRKHALNRIQAGFPMPGIFTVPQDLPVSRAIEDIVLLAECSLDGEWEGQIRFLPL
jgi:hypothetical protein